MSSDKAFNIPDGDVSALIEAINAANGAEDFPTINLAENGLYTLTEVIDETDGANGLPSITSSIWINGNGATIERRQGEETPTFRIFHVALTGDLTLKRATVKNGCVIGKGYAGEGGGILNFGMLTWFDSVIFRANFPSHITDSDWASNVE